MIEVMVIVDLVERARHTDSDDAGMVTALSILIAGMAPQTRLLLAVDVIREAHRRKCLPMLRVAKAIVDSASSTLGTAIAEIHLMERMS